MSKIAISIDHQQVGLITFQSPNHLQAHRTAGGFRLHLPIMVTLHADKGATTRPLLTNLRAALSYQSSDGVIRHLGQASSEGIFAGEASAYSDLIWFDSLVALTAYDRLRNGKPPRIKARVSAEVCWLFNTARWIRTEPFSLEGETEVQYQTEAWVSMLRHLGVAENVLVEVPLPGTAPTEWEEVWRALVEARNAFEQGQETGWSQCAVKVRHALELWREIEPETMWDGFKAPREALEAWAKPSRLDGIRWHLFQCASAAAHPKGAWSRDDALLMLSTLSALLAVRKP